MRATCRVLLTWDVEAIVQWFRDLLEGKEIEDNPLGSIEPNLEMEYVDRIGDKWIIRFRFAAEFKPDDMPEDGSLCLTAELNATQMGHIADSFAEVLKMFPRRVHEPSEVLTLLRKVRVLLAFFIVGLVLAGLSAMPIRAEVQWLERITEALAVTRWWPAMAAWISRVHDGVMEAGREQPFLFYGTDWLAFGHFVLAVMFLGSLRDPVRNLWVVHAGMVACVLVIPWAFLFGPIRGIPFFWQLIDCSFGVLGIIPLCLAGRYIRRIITLEAQASSAP